MRKPKALECDRRRRSLGGQWQDVSWKDIYQFFRLPVNPYVAADDPSSDLLLEISPHKAGAKGERDHRVQAYNFRMYLSDKEGLVPFPKPDGYDPARCGLLAWFLDFDNGIKWTLNHATKPMTDGPVQMCNGDSNNGCSFSSDLVDGTIEPVSFTELPLARRGLTMPFRELHQIREKIFQEHVTNSRV